ncbi:Hypothetical protein CINCED_3A021397 [Cinara cedri]|uniref:KICSTOR complex protein SZT2 n=1 Tax=Cinara cedri TaxID=506608 RepID=A0A5E4MWR1_9HEMI|nr:Hypothetical protein CINCED_3A021397 [Cinara cedri]
METTDNSSEMFSLTDNSSVTLSTDNSTVTLSTDNSTVTLSTDNSTVTLSTDINNCTITTSTDTNSYIMASSSDTNSYMMMPSTDISNCLMTSPSVTSSCTIVLSTDTSSCTMTSSTNTTSCIMTLSMDTNSNMITSSTNSNSCTITSSTEADSNSVPSVVISTQSQPKNDNGNDIFNYEIPLIRAISLESYIIASSVYIMIDEGRTMDADRRLMWYLKRLGTVQMVDEKFEDIEMEEPCKIMSFIPRKERNNKKTSVKSTSFVMDTFTRVYFMTPVYNMVYCLDMSPSNCTVDIQRGYVMLDEMMVALRRSIEGFIRPFIVPGSKKILFEPQVYVTVIVHTPFFTSLAQQVLVQGWLINSHNFVHFFRTISFEMNRLENSLAKTKIVIEKTKSCDNDNNTSENENEIPKNQKSNINKSPYNRTSCNEEHRPTINNNNPDSGFINTLRYGMLAVRLLPQSNISNLVVITDGMISLADIQVLDLVLNQLRSIGVACSFLHVSSQFHPNSSHGLVPYPELMQLIATATSGTYLNSFPKTLPNLVVNYYHTKFIMWSFKRGDAKESPITKLSCTPPRVRTGEWTIRNSSFYGNREPQLVSKKQISDHVHAHLENIICCRMREGFLVKDIQLKDAGNNNNSVLDITNPCKLHLKLVLPWTNHIYIEYDIITKWPPPVIPMEPIVIQNITENPSDSTTESKQVPPQPQPDDSLNIHYTVVVKGPYEFLHDITCSKTKKYLEQSQTARSFKFQLSSCRSSSISFAAATTTITKKTDYIMSDRSSTRVISSMYRQALIARFWSTMQSIVQTDVLIKHLETYSPSTGHLFDSENQPKQQTENHDLSPLKLEIPLTTEIDEIDDICLSPLSLNSIIDHIVMTANADGAESKSTVNLAIPGALNKSPLLNGVPLFYHLPLNSNYYFSLKQNKVKLDGQQKNYIDQQHQQFVDFWKPVCTLDPESQWPKWFSTYRIGGGVLLLRHDRPLPRWLHMPNIENEPYTIMTVTCRKAAKSLFALLKHWCTFVLIDDHSYVKCLNKNETLTGNLSFCIARVSLKAPSCCCVVLHLAFQSCVPASIHYEIIDDLRNKIVLLDSTTVVNYLLSTDDQQQQPTDEKKKPEEKKKEETELKVKKKSTRLQKYVYLLDKPLEKILVRYERIPSQFTTVIFPDGSQPNPGVSVSNLQNINYKSKRRQILDVAADISTKVELKAVTATTTLSRYLYHRRWIWSSGRSYYSNCFSNVSPNLQLHLARTLSVLTNVRLKEGFRFAHSSTGIINMVLQVDMIEGSKACPSTPTSHCLIQYVLFPPNISHKFRTKYNDNVHQITLLKKKNVDDKSTSTSSIEDASQKQKKNMITSESGDSNDCYSLPTTEDDYQLITECWIEPQHGLVVVNKKQNNKYMVGLNYEQLADALWRVDSDCIGSLFTFQHMQHMCKDPNMSVSDLDVDLDKSVIVDAGRIHKLPFTFSLVKVLPKCRHHSSMTFSLFTKCEEEGTDLAVSVKDHKKMNSMLERSFYSRLQTINDRAFDVNDSEYSDDSVYNMNRPTVKMNEQEIGQCFMKRVDDTRLILTITPSYAEENSTIEDNFFEDCDFDLEPFVNRSRAYTWHYTKRNIGGQSIASLNMHQQENSMNYYRTMSVGSTPYYSDSNNLTWAQLRLDRNLCNFDNKDTKNCSSSGLDRDLQNVPTIMNIEVYDCRQQDIENVLTSDSDSYDHTIIDNYTNEYSTCSSLSSSDEDEEEKEEENITIKEQFYYNQPAVDPMLMDKYLHKVKLVYNHSYVTTVFHALHLGFNVPYMDIQRAVDRCQHRLVSFEITDYLKVVCNHFKTNSNSCAVCSAENHVLKSHHDEIHSTFSSTLDRYMLKPVLSHPDYYFYDYIEKLDEDEDGYCVNYRMSEHDTSHKQEVDEQDLFPLFVHLVCTVKTNKLTKSQSVRSLPTCIFELLNQDVESESIRSLNLSNVKVSLDVYCLMLPNNDYDYDCDDEEDNDDDRYYQRSYSDKLHFPIINNSLKQTKQNPFIYLCYSIPSRYAQGLAEFIAEVEWCMRDEMAAGLLKDPIVTPHTLEKLIEHISSSPNSSSNEHRQIPVNFVLPTPLLQTGSNKYDSLSQFLQKLDQLEIILDHDYDDRFYAIEKSTENTFYVVKKDLQFSPDSTASEIINYEDTEINFDPDVSLTYSECYKPVLPNFWVILKVLEEQREKNTDNNNSINKIIVNVYFHCRFSELDIQKKYTAVREVLGKNLRQAAIQVNQTILLHHLHDTRTCDPFLEPIIEDLIYSDEGINSIKY